MKDILFKEKVINYIIQYYEKNGEIPKAKEWKIKDGFPCCREELYKKLLNKDYTYNDLIEEAGLKKRVPYNAKRDTLTKEELIEFIQQYYSKNGVVPCLNEWKQKNGFPCNKQFLTNNYIYNDLVAEAGFKTYKYGQRHYNEEKLLQDIRRAIIESRKFNISQLHDEFEYIKHRDVYANLFGNFENVLIAAGIENRHKILIKSFPEYRLEDPIDFLKKKFGNNGEFTPEQRELILTIQEAAKGGDLRREVMGKKISLHRCKHLFKTYTIALIAANLNPAKAMRARMVAEDGHICDSYGEMLVDNILNNLNIEHSIHKRYPGSKLICDFYINDNIYIEYIEFSQVKSDYIRGRYLERLDKKRSIVEEIGGQLITVDKVDDSTIEFLKTAIIPLLKDSK